MSIDSCCAISLAHSYVQDNQLAFVEAPAQVPDGDFAREPESDEVSGFIHVLWILTGIGI